MGVGAGLGEGDAADVGELDGLGLGDRESEGDAVEEVARVVARADAVDARLPCPGVRGARGDGVSGAEGPDDVGLDVVAGVLLERVAVDVFG